MTAPTKLAKFLVTSALAMAFASTCALSQTTDDKQADPCKTQSGPVTTKTFYLTNVGQQNDPNEIMYAIRDLLCPGATIRVVNSQHALVLQARPEQLALAEKLISELDRPRKTYRLTYTLTELDAGKAIGTQHYSMVVVQGLHTSIKEGDKVPVATGSYSNGVAATSPSSEVQTQFTYLDVGMNFDATVNEASDGVQLQSKVEQSSLGQPSTIAGVQEPVVRQTVLQGTSFLTPGKPVMLGSIDIPSSTRHFDIAVVLDQVK